MSMIRKMTTALLVAAILATALGPAAAAQGKPAVAIMPFKEGQLTQWWSWDWNLAEGVTQLVTDEIVKRNTLTVVERTRIEELVTEQDFGDEGRIEAETASQIGKLLGARLMVMGTISEFIFQQTGGIGIGPFRVSGSRSKVKLTGRVVDSENGRVLGSFEGEGSRTGTSFSVDSYRGLSLSGEEFQASTLGVATVTAVRKFVDELEKVTSKVATQVAAEEKQLAQSGTVVAVLPGDQIVISLGSKHGVKLNAILNISRLQSFPGLAAPVNIPVGTAKAISVDADGSVAHVESKTQDVQVGDSVVLK